MTHIAHRNSPGRPPDAFTRATYALLDAYAADGHIELSREDWTTGAESGLILASDVLIERGASWDECDADVVRAMMAVAPGFEALSPSLVDTVLRFRRWLAETGRASADGIDGLEALAEEIGDQPAFAARPNRAERRWQARFDRRRVRLR